MGKRQRPIWNSALVSFPVLSHFGSLWTTRFAPKSVCSRSCMAVNREQSLCFFAQGMCVIAVTFASRGVHFDQVGLSVVFSCAANLFFLSVLRGCRSSHRRALNLL